MFKTLSLAAMATFAAAQVNRGAVTINVDGNDQTMWVVGNN
jgi:hypothetical protein